MRGWLKGLGALSGFLGASGVALAAIGAHRSGDSMVTTAAYFLLFHAAALVGLCAVAAMRCTRGVLVAASLIAAGVVLFSGELAMHALSGVAPLPFAAPMGGMTMILGWLVAAVALASAVEPGAQP